MMVPTSTYLPLGVKCANTGSGALGTRLDGAGACRLALTWQLVKLIHSANPAIDERVLGPPVLRNTER